MACSKPVVNTSLDSGVPFVSRHEESGITVPPRNPGALAGAINKLLDDPGLRAVYGRAARQRVEREFSRERMILSMLSVYDGVAGSSGSRSKTRSRKSTDEGAPGPHGALRRVD
jgi:rhamnosyl/mannosyltransferase